ncbi:indigoidine synthase A family protein [Kwoniella heveanensis BCC8398]|uniref:Indigoidine synthase A family protein n=1 Tax=Kwoniella heveanensis BCC8398 TaxID=1296120 RepID=A0A1B9GUB2_9TREE|nr:indigoidine synthase A family protein [Kwoniella heveanensis BCC8398]
MFLSTARRGLVKSPFKLRSVRAIASLSQARQSWGNRLVISEEVEHALHTKAPIIALESAIITHGMPHPTNLTTASSLESIIRSRSVTPATVALINGRIHVGLSGNQLEALSDPSSGISKGAVKVSRRDLGPALALGKTGGTTVAGTMYIASSLGIKVFVTGGIGGVHRGAESSMDISADLIELGRTPMAVFCAGAKSILDIPRTLEVLETQGVCVATYGDKQEFPAFYHPSSGCQSPWRVPDSDSAARLIQTSLTLPTPLSTLLAVPIPSEHAEAGAQVQEAVEQAVRESVEQGVDKRGKEVTPWLLKRVGELTQGEALDLNVKLIENNARIGSEVAVRLADLYRSRGSGSGSEQGGEQHASGALYSSKTSPSWSSSGSSASRSGPQLPSSGPNGSLQGSTSVDNNLSAPVVGKSPLSAGSSPVLPSPRVLVFGSAAIDLTSTSTHSLVPRSTTPGSVFVSPGGVGRNIAEAAQNLLPPHSVQMISAYGSEGASGSDPASNPSKTASLERTPLTAHPERALANTLQSTVEESQQCNKNPDAFGKLLMLEFASAGLRTDGLIATEGRSTAVCSLTLERDGDLVAGVADMGIVETVKERQVEEAIRKYRPEMVVFDTNLLEGVIRTLLRTCQELSIPTFCDPTSTPKLPRILPSLISLTLPSSEPTATASSATFSAPPQAHATRKPLKHISPNLLELDLLHSLISAACEDDPELDRRVWGYLNALNLGSEWRNAVERLTASSTSGSGVSSTSIPDADRAWIRTGGVVQKMVGCLPFIDSFWLKASHRGLLHLRISSTRPGSSDSHKSSNTAHSIYQKLDGVHGGKYLVLTHYPAPRINPEDIVSTTGAGDTLVGGLVAGLVGSQVGQGDRGGSESAGEGELHIPAEDEGVWVERALERVKRSLMSRRAVG